MNRDIDYTPKPFLEWLRELNKPKKLVYVCGCGKVFEPANTSHLCDKSNKILGYLT